MLQHVRAARSGAMPRRAVSPSRDCARQRSSLLIVSPRHWISIWRGMGALKGLALPMRPPAPSHAVESGIAPRRIYTWRHRRHGRRNAFPPRARPAYMQGRARSARIPSGYKGAAMRPRAPSGPHLCAECEDDAEREIVLDTARGCAYYSILRQARKRLSEPRGRPRRREP